MKKNTLAKNPAVFTRTPLLQHKTPSQPLVVFSPRETQRGAQRLEVRGETSCSVQAMSFHYGHEVDRSNIYAPHSNTALRGKDLEVSVCLRSLIRPHSTNGHQ